MKNLLTLTSCLFLLSTIGCSNDKEPPVGDEAPVQAPQSQDATPEAGEEPVLAQPVMPEDVRRLAGHWRRPDGGYVIKIEAVQKNGTMKAGYFNPNPINVAEARWTAVEDQVGVFIELRDTNYPGATYRLLYDRQADALSGVYYQPIYKQEYQVAFQRVTD